MDRLWNTLCFLLSSDRVRKFKLHLKMNQSESLRTHLSRGGRHGRFISIPTFLGDDEIRGALLANADQSARDSYDRFLGDESDCDRLSQKVDPQTLSRLQSYLDAPVNLQWYVETRFYED